MTELTEIRDSLKKYKSIIYENGEYELKYYSYGFECPDISKLKDKEEKLSNCCGKPFIENSDVCSDCKEHAGEIK